MVVILLLYIGDPKLRLSQDYGSLYYFGGLYYYTLFEKQSKFPRYYIKCRGKPDTTVLEIFRVVSRFPPLHFMSYRGESITVGTVY